MSGRLSIQGRQRLHQVDRPLLRRILQSLLQDLLRLDDFDLGLYLVGEEEMTRANEQFLRHSGSTDVITFDYRDPDRPGVPAGELFICIAEAVRQAPRFRTSWQAELVRYAVHGVLHLHGYDDLKPKDRLRMKRRENQLMRTLRSRFNLDRLGKQKSSSR